MSQTRKRSSAELKQLRASKVLAFPEELERRLSPAGDLAPFLDINTEPNSDSKLGNMVEAGGTLFFSAWTPTTGSAGIGYASTETR